MFKSIRSHWRDALEKHPRLQYVVSALQQVAPINFITIHYVYFILLTFVSSVIFWGSSNPRGSIHYVDCLFLVVSASTNTGLNTVNLSQMTTWQQVLLWILFIIGSVIWISWWTVMIRKRAFEDRFDHIVQAQRERTRRMQEARTGPKFRKIFSRDKSQTLPSPSGILPGLGTRQSAMKRINETTELEVLGSPARRIVSAPGEAAAENDHDDAASKSSTIAPDASNPAGEHITFATSAIERNVDRNSIYQHGQDEPRKISRRSSVAESAESDESEDFLDHFKRFLGKHNVSRSGQIYDLSSDEREALGGCEYRALKVLAVTVPMYGFLWQGLCAIALGAWIKINKPQVATDFGANPWWAGIFLSVSAFNNAGMAVNDTNMVPFQSSYFVLIVVALLVLVGNTAYPIMLRFIFWSILKILNFATTPGSYVTWKETLEFILKYPRRVYTTLFPSRQTWWLFSVLTIINLIDWAAFEVLNIGNATIDALPVGQRMMAGLFQAIVVRAAGFTVVSISSLYPGVQLLYLIMMYVSVYPVVITMRHSNVYEERSLGIYEDDPEVLANNAAEANEAVLPAFPAIGPSKAQQLRRRATAAVQKKAKAAMTFHGVGVRGPPKSADENSRISFIGQQIRGQLAHDLWWLVLAVLIIMIIETDHFLERPLEYSIFNVLFEATSAYGNVGLSVGLPDQNYSFVGSWHKGSKLVLTLVMLRGRHRGLPVAIDRAVRLPGEELYKEEEEDQKIRRTKTMMERVASRDM